MKAQAIDILLTKPELMEILKVSLGTVNNMIRNKDIPVVKIGSTIKFKKSDVFAYIEKNTHR